MIEFISNGYIGEEPSADQDEQHVIITTVGEHLLSKRFLPGKLNLATLPNPLSLAVHAHKDMVPNSLYGVSGGGEGAVLFNGQEGFSESLELLGKGRKKLGCILQGRCRHLTNYDYHGA